MKIAPFELERYFAKYEFTAKYLLSSSDCDGFGQQDLLKLADSSTKSLWDNLRLGYTESLGNPLLRKEISTLYRGISEDSVIVLTPEEGIFIAINTILKKGDHIICTYPGYQSLYSIAEAIGCDVTHWEPHEEKGWYFDPADLESLVKPTTKLLIVNFPHNPTGYLPSHNDWNRIIEFARKHNLYILSDEMYRYLEYDSGQRLSSACEIYDKALSLFGMSKTFGMAGVRIGWLTTQNKTLFERIATFKDFTTICSSAPSEILSLIALRAKNTLIRQNLITIQKNLGVLDDFMQRNSHIFSYTRPLAGTICFPRLKVKLKSDEFCQRVVKDTAIMILPSTVYNYKNSHIRIGFGRHNFPEVLSIFEEYLVKEFT